MLAVDGTEPAELRKIMHASLESAAQIEGQLPSVFESAGGFSPKIGILGAVLGLIGQDLKPVKAASAGACSMSPHYRQIANWPLLDAQHLDDNALSTLSIELRVEHTLPGSQVETSSRHR